ncbi:MAG: efflux RND transporter periplasmic adaptor subunit [Chitinophagaceae bacterium]
MKKKWIWLLVALVVIIVTLLVLKSKGIIGKDESTKVAIEAAALRTITEVVTASGKVYPELEVKISPDVSGEIVELNVQEGDSVKKGQLLARVYADILATQRDQAVAGVMIQEAQVQNTGASLQAFKARLEQAEKQYTRQKKLYEEKVISRLEFEQAESGFLTAKADYNAASQTIKSGNASVKSAEASLQRANKDLGRTSVLAPMDGVVSLLNVKKGERVVGSNLMSGTEIMRIADMRVIEVRVDVGENDIPKVKIGDTAIVEVDAYNNRKFNGIVTQIASTNRSATGSALASSTEVTNYEVRIRLDTASYNDLFDPTRPKSFPFRPGMSASADIQTKTHTKVLAVPINAVTTRDKSDTGKAEVKAKEVVKKEGEGNAAENEEKTSNSDDIDEVVFVLQEDNTVKRVKVVTDIQDLNYIEIRNGIKLGDQVIVAPYTAISKLLREGMKVKVMPKEKLFESKE